MKWIRIKRKYVLRKYQISIPVITIIIIIWAIIIITKRLLRVSSFGSLITFIIVMHRFDVSDYRGLVLGGVFTMRAMVRFDIRV